MQFRYVEQGIAAIQAGNIEEGARLLRIALKDPTLVGGVRAIACLWLAEISADPQAKRQYYDEALAADPNNADIRHRVERWMASQLPAPPAPAAPPQPAYPPPAAPTYPPPASYTSGDSASVPTIQPAFPQPTTYTPASVNPAYPPTLPDDSARLGYPAQTVPPYAAPQPPIRPGTGPLSQPAGNYHIVGVIGGPNGPGTAFFVTRDGLLVTTRYVVGGVENLTIEIERGRQIAGRVVRAFPEFDVALIYVPQPVAELMPVTPLPRIPDGTPLLAVGYAGGVIRGELRPTRRLLSPNWFPTTFTQPLDAGGSPVLDENRYVVGMLTRNTSGVSPELYGVSIGSIRRLVEVFRQEMTDSRRVYCPHCGYVSQIIGLGGFYCELCGGMTPTAETAARFIQAPANVRYAENSPRACRHCGARVGLDSKGVCLRCGRGQA